MIKENFVNIGKYLKDKRIKAGLKQVDVAQSLKCKSQFVCNWERGASTPPWRLMKSLVKLYRISDSEIVNFMLKEYELMIKTELGLKKEEVVLESLILHNSGPQTGQVNLTGSCIQSDHL